VETPDTRVNVGITSVNLPESSSSKSDSAAYARPLRKVGEQQTKVAKYLTRRKWGDVVEKSSDWMEQIRKLRGYAHTSHDTRLFRECCDALLTQAQTLRQAAMRRDSVRAQQAFDACDPPLNRLVRSFPPNGVTMRRDSASETRNWASGRREARDQPATVKQTQQVP
jgi:hypothetical protein